MRMEPSHYLDSEVLKYSNYPEMKRVAEQLDQLDNFTMEVNSAIAGYVEGMDAKVYVDVNALTEHIELCRGVLDILGQAEEPCYDVIIDIRVVLENFYEILYAHRKFGTEYVDYKTTASTMIGSEKPWQ